MQLSTKIKPRSKSLRDDKISRAYAKAVQDSLYMADLQESMEGWKMFDDDANQFLDAQFDYSGINQ